MTEQKSRLVIEISSKQAEQNVKQLSEELTKIFNGGEKASSSTSKLGRTIQVTSNITQNFNTTVNNTTKAVEKQTQELAKQEKQLGSNSSAVKTLAGHLAAYVTINSAIDKMDTFTGLQNRLKLVTNSQTELNRAMNDTFVIAQNTRQSWQSAAQVYQGFANNAKTLGLSMSDTARLTETVSKAVAMSGSSTQASEAALIQFNQALSSGVLRGEELNSVMEQAPGLAKAIAEGMGITVGQLRKVASEGKITSDVLVNSLTKSKASVDELFSKTDMTIGQSITLLNNELTKFVGGAGQSSGAAKTLADSIQLLSQNLAPLADGAMVIGIGYLTKSILEKAVATRIAIAASIQNQVSMIAEKTATVELTGIEAFRARQNVALAAQEVRSAELAVLNAKTKDAQALATQRLATAEVAHNIAIKESTIATAQYTLAQDSLNKSKSLGSKLLTMVGGPIGALTLAAMGLAAGYMYLQKSADDANAKLEEQGKVASIATEELLKLEGAKRGKAKTDLAESFDAENKKLKLLNTEIGNYIAQLSSKNTADAETAKILKDVRMGTMTYDDALEKLNKSHADQPDIITKMEAAIVKYKQSAVVAQNNAEKQKAMGSEVRVAGNEAQNSVIKHKAQADVIEDVSSAAERAKKKLEDLQKSYAQKNLDTDFSLINIKSHGLEMGKALSEFYDDNKIPKTRSLTSGEFAIFQKYFDKQQSLKSLEENITKSKKDQNSASEKQLKLSEKQAVLLAGNSEKTRNMLRVYQSFRNAGLGDKQARVMTAQVGRENDFRNSDMFGSHKDANNGYTNTGFISWQKTRSTQLMQFLQGQGTLDKNGKIQQTQESLDAMAKFLMQEIATDKSYGKTKNALNNDSLSYRDLERIISKNFIGWDYDGKKLGKAKASQHLAKQDNYYNQISNILGANPENVLSSIKNLSKFEDEAYKARAKTEEEIKKLRSQYDTDAIKRSKARDEEINQAIVLGQLNLIPKIKERYDAQDKLAELQLDEELNSYKWTEAQKIQYTYDTNIQRLDADGNYNDEVKAKYKAALKELHSYELAAYERLQQDKLDAFKASLEQQTGELQRAYFEVIAQNKMTQPQLSMWQFQNQYSSSVGGAYDSYQNSVKDINKKDDNNQYLNDTDTRNKMLLDAENNYQNQLLLIKMKGVEDEKSLRTQQQVSNLSTYGAMFGGMADLVKGYGSEASGIYRTLFFAQKSFALAQAGMNVSKAASDAFANEPGTVWQKIGAAAIATVQSGSLLKMIQAATPQGFYTGGLYTGSGHVRGAGTETSDSINARLSDYEFVTRAWAVKRIGVENMEYMNRTGELPFQHEYEALKIASLVPNKNENVNSYNDGGLIGVSKLSGANRERRQVESIQQSSTQQSSTQTTEPNITIQVNVTDSGVSTQSNQAEQKQLGQMIGNAVRAVIRQEQRQGGLLSK